MKLSKEEHYSRPSLGGMEFERISRVEKDMLERPFSEEEVWNIISGMSGDKSLGPDGFSISFFKKCWDIVKRDLMKVFEEFYYSEEFYEHLNNTFITLIPKKHNAKELYRPISLLSSVYKIISKTLTSKLKLVVKGIIAQSQGTFIGGRQILDCALIANECILDRRVSGQCGVLCKLDMEKAYDHLN